MIKIRPYWPAVRTILFGCVLMLAGLSVWKTGWDFKHGLPVFHWVGLFCGGVGLFFVFIGILLWRSASRTIETLCPLIICPVCETIMEIQLSANPKCPRDGAALEPLDGYYDRHPERRKAPITLDEP